MSTARLLMIWLWSLATSLSIAIGQQADNIQFGFVDDLFNRVWTFPTHPGSDCIFQNDSRGTVNTLCSQWTQIEPAQQFWNSGQSTSISHLALSCEVNNPFASNELERTGQTADDCACASFQANDKEAEDRNDEVHFWPCQIESIAAWSGTNLSSVTAAFLDNMGLQRLEGLEDWVSLEFLRISRNNINRRGMPRDFVCTLASLQVLILADAFNVTENGSEFHWDMLTCGSEVSSPSQLAGLVITDTELQTVQANAFLAMPHLQLLQLINDHISMLDADSFAGLTNLTQLKLTNNHISDIPSGVFVHLSRLLYLYLDQNRITHLRLSDFYPLKKLEGLSLENNAIQTIDGSFYLMKKLEVLSLQFNEMAQIPSHLFQNSTFLQLLNISHNSVHDIARDAFLDMVFLIRLDLSWNNLGDSVSLKKVFGGRQLERVKQLHLQHNNLTSVIDSMFYDKPYSKLRLALLDLSWNQIQYVHLDAFDGMEYLLTLNLEGNHISRLVPRTFSKHPRLLYLFLNSNYLEELPGDLFFNGSLIGWLGLENMQFKAIPTFDYPLDNLQILILYNNSISAIRRSDLQLMPSLGVLDLGRCNISSIELGSFENQRNIKQIVLNHNQLELNFSINTFGNLYYLEVLNLSYNRIRSLDNLLVHTLKFVSTLDLSGNPIKELPEYPLSNPDGRINYASIESLFLRGCQIRRIAPRAFSLFRAITYIDLSNNKLEEFRPFELPTLTRNYVIFMEGNPIKCSCQMAWLQDPDLSSYYRVSSCIHVINKASVRIWGLPREEFICQNLDSCLIQPKACRCFASENNGPTTYVDCSHNQLTSIPKGIPGSTKKLHLEGNYFEYLSLENLEDRTQVTDLYLEQCAIKDIQADTFAKLPFLNSLHLHSNLLTNLTARTFPQMYLLKYLHLHDNNISVISPKTFSSLVALNLLTLHDNKLEQLDQAVMSDVSSLIYLQNLTLHGNPWNCPCDNGTFKNWLQNQSDHIGHLNDVMCNHTSIISIPDEDFLCYNPYKLTVVHSGSSHKAAFVWALTTAVLLLTVLIAIVLVLRHRTVLAVIIYNKFGYRLSEDECESWLYDAIVMYDGSNRGFLHWLRYELVATLEPQFKLCIPDRDFVPGTVESEEVVKRISMSKRSIIALSSNSLANEKLIYMFQRAYYRLTIEDSRHRILIVLLEDFDLREALDNPQYEENIKAFLSTKQFMRVTDKRFWQKLLYKLPRPQSSESDREALSRKSRSDKKVAMVECAVPMCDIKE